MLRLILAGLLAFPALLVSLAASIVVALLSFPSVWLLKFRKASTSSRSSSSSEKNDNRKQHAIITGGSSGIGLAVAKECVLQGMDRVTIIARNQEKLTKCQEELEALANTTTTTKVEALSVDVTDTEALAMAASQIFDGETNVSTYLFCCAGIAQPGSFTKLPPTAFRNQMNTNYLGTVQTVHTFLPHITNGTIVLTSSAGGQVGVFGFTAYAPTKFALRGFAESLHMELLDNENIHIQMIFPPDTDTPGFAEENKQKPRETQLIADTLGLMQPQDVGRRMVHEASGTAAPKFAVYFGFEGWMLSTLTAGMSPESSMIDLVAQVALMGLLRFVSLFFLNDFWRTIRNYQKQQDQASSDNDKNQETDYYETIGKKGAS